MAIWGPDAQPRGSVEAGVIETAPRPAERWIDLFLLPAVALAFAACITIAGMAVLMVLEERSGIPRAADPAHYLLSPPVLYASMAGFYLAALGLAAILLRLRGYSIRKAFFARGGVSAWLAAPLGAAAALGAMYLLLRLPEAMQQELVERSAALQPETPAAAVALFIIVVLLAPLAEEIYFRGVMLRLLARRMGFALAAMVSAILFSLSHGHLMPSVDAAGFVLTGILFLLGIVFALLARGSLRAPFVMHAAYNATLTLPGIYMLLTAQS